MMQRTVNRVFLNILNIRVYPSVHDGHDDPDVSRTDKDIDIPAGL